MLAAGTAMFLLIPAEGNQRVLRPGKVAESSKEEFVARMDDAVVLAAGADVVAYGDLRGKFYQQGAAVIEVREEGPTPLIAFKRVGDPVSAEQRQMFRVSTAALRITAAIGRERNCPVMDISPEGFAAVAATGLQVGSLVNVNMLHDGQAINTTARVQTVKPRTSGKSRYGFLVPEKTSAARRTLERLTGTIQREQLRRLAGAA